jgi:heme ABC exporter ATP-binding subunit CcmA
MLEIIDLKFAFQHTPLFENINFVLQGGELLHITGPNGSGKSTLLSIVAGLRKPTGGHIRYTLENRTPDAKDCVAYLAAENNGLYHHISARENIEFWGALHGHTLTSNTNFNLQEWGLVNPWLKSLPVGRFSTGMKRRLGLARVQLSKRPCLLLDEPLNGLDKEGVLIFKKMIEGHLSAKGCVILVSHDTHLLDPYITRELSLK